MIEGIFGKPGKGKTYEGVRRLLLEADLGRQCYSVTPIDHPNVEMIDYTELIDPWLPPGIIFLDEVHLVLSTRSGPKLDKRFYEKLSQTRKDGHDLIYTSQHESKVLKQLRDNTNYGWITQAMSLPLLGRCFTAKCYDMDKGLRRGKPEASYFHVGQKRVFNAYDTRFAIAANEATEDGWAMVGASEE